MDGFQTCFLSPSSAVPEEASAEGGRGPLDPPGFHLEQPEASLHAHTTSEEGHQCRVAAQQEGDLAETRMSAQHVGLSEELGQGWCLSARSVLWEVGSLGLSRAEALQASLLSPCGVAESGGRARMCQDRAWPHSSPGGHRGPGGRRQQVEKPWSSQRRTAGGGQWPCCQGGRMPGAGGLAWTPGALTGLRPGGGAAASCLS